MRVESERGTQGLRRGMLQTESVGNNGHTVRHTVCSDLGHHSSLVLRGVELLGQGEVDHGSHLVREQLHTFQLAHGGAQRGGVVTECGQQLGLVFHDPQSEVDHGRVVSSVERMAAGKVVHWAARKAARKVANLAVVTAGAKVDHWAAKWAVWKVDQTAVSLDAAMADW